MADPTDRATCIARGGTWENGVCFMPDQKEEKRKGRVSPKDPTREEMRQKQLKEDPRFAEQVRQAELKKQQSIISEVSGETAEQKRKKEEAVEAIKGAEKVTEEPQIEEIPEIEEAPGVLSLDGISNLLSGRPVKIGGKTYQTGMRGGDIEVLGGSLPLGIGAVAAGAPSLAGKTSAFLNKFSAAGKIKGATQATGVLTAPAKARAGASTLKISALTLLGYSGLGTIKSVTSNLLTSKVQKIEAEVTKVGEQLTKIPEASSLGFSLDEEGNLYEYTPSLALQDIEGVEQSLMDAETSLQTASIGQIILKITGRYNLAQAEIDKQKREITVARGKVLNQIANPSESLLNSRDFFRSMELLE